MSSLANVRIRPTGGRGRGSTFRWDRAARWALLLLLAVILALYISPLRSYVTQRGTAGEHRQELRGLQKENAVLKGRERELQRPATLERAARRLGMVREGERAYVITNP